jgi:hypothetical protein
MRIAGSCDHVRDNGTGNMVGGVHEVPRRNREKNNAKRSNRSMEQERNNMKSFVIGTLALIVGMIFGGMMQSHIDRKPSDIKYIPAQKDPLLNMEDVYIWPEKDVPRMFPTSIGVVIKTDSGCYISTGTFRGAFVKDRLLESMFPGDCSIRFVCSDCAESKLCLGEECK